MSRAAGYTFTRRAPGRSFAKKASRKNKNLARLAEMGAAFDLNGPVPSIHDDPKRVAPVSAKLFDKPGAFIAAAAEQAEVEALNPMGTPEIAFVGKSNVGKSSLLNSLMRTDIVNTSKSPGRTKGINFFGVGEGSLRLVDLPGYGYARASKYSIQELHRRVYEYVFTRDPTILMHVFVLVDCRRGQPSDAEIELMRAMDREGMRYRVVLTKADTLAKDDILQAVVNTAWLTKDHLACDPLVNVVSTKKEFGIQELRDSIAQLYMDWQRFFDAEGLVPGGEAE